MGEGTCTSHSACFLLYFLVASDRPCNIACRAGRKVLSHIRDEKLQPYDRVSRKEAQPSVLQIYEPGCAKFSNILGATASREVYEEAKHACCSSEVGGLVHTLSSV